MARSGIFPEDSQAEQGKWAIRLDDGSRFANTGNRLARLGCRSGVSAITVPGQSAVGLRKIRGNPNRRLLNRLEQKIPHR